jgi:hypothetical protein
VEFANLLIPALTKQITVKSVISAETEQERIAKFARKRYCLFKCVFFTDVSPTCQNCTEIIE